MTSTKDALELAKAVRIMLPIVEEAYWEQHIAGTMPGAGYHHKAQHLAGQQWDWRNSEKFQEWAKSVREALKEIEG